MHREASGAKLGVSAWRGTERLPTDAARSEEDDLDPAAISATAESTVVDQTAALDPGADESVESPDGSQTETGR